MNPIIEAMQNQENDLRLSCNNNRWMLGDGDGCWTVYEHLPHARKTIVIIITNDLDAAVAFLLNKID